MFIINFLFIKIYDINREIKRITTLKNDNRKIVRIALQTVVSILLIIFVIYRVFYHKSFQIPELTCSIFFIILITSISQVFINVLIQKTIFSIFGFQFSFFPTAKYNFISSMYLLIIPGFFAPDFYLGYYFNKTIKNISITFLSLFFNRVIGFATFSFFALLGIFLVGKKFLNNFTITAEKLGLIIGVIVGTFLIIIILVRLLIFKKLIGIVNQIKTVVYQFWKNKKASIITLMLKLIFNVTGFIGRFWIGRLVGIELHWIEFIAVILIVNFIIILPISVNGIGIRETGYIGLLILMGIPQDIAFTFSLLEFGITMSSALIGAVLFFLQRVKVLSGTLSVVGE